MLIYESLLYIYILFIWLVVLHTFEEISQNIFDLKVGPIKITKKKYLFVASLISTINLGTLALLVAGNRAGLYLGVFTSSIIGIAQGIVHTIGFIKENRKPKGFGAGFYSSIPLSIIGLVLLYKIIQIM
jgi:hypothetical protein